MKELRSIWLFFAVLQLIVAIIHSFTFILTQNDIEGVYSLLNLILALNWLIMANFEEIKND